jgi:hypothetical protein
MSENIYLEQYSTGISDNRLKVCISNKQGNIPRVRVFMKNNISQKSKCLKLTIEKDSIIYYNTLNLSIETLKEIKLWVYLNYPVLLELWNEDTDYFNTLHYLNMLRRIDE